MGKSIPILCSVEGKGGSLAFFCNESVYSYDKTYEFLTKISATSPKGEEIIRSGDV